MYGSFDGECTIKNIGKLFNFSGWSYDIITTALKKNRQQTTIMHFLSIDNHIDNHSQ